MESRIRKEETEMATSESLAAGRGSGPSPSQRITEVVSGWPGVEAGFGRRGEFAFRVGRREIGHLHGDRSAHFSLDRKSVV